MKNFFRLWLLLGIVTSAQAQEQEQEQTAPPETVETIPVAATAPPQTEPVEEETPASDDATQLEEVTVTATKRARSQREIPGSVNAIKGEALEKISAQSLEDYLKLVPGVSMSRQAADRNIITIRGINSSVGFGFTAVTVGTYVDDIPLQDLFIPVTVPDLNPFDLERVEILKGPQGTLFGSGALAGAVRYILQKPNLAVFEGKFSATVAQPDIGGMDEVFGGAINVPFGESFALRGVALVRKDAGNVDEVLRPEQDVNNVDQVTGRILARWQATERLSLSALYFKQETEQSDLGFTDSKTEFRRGKTPRPSPTDSTFDGANLTANYEFDGSTLVSTSNLLGKKATSRIFADGAIGQDSFGFEPLEPQPDDPNGDDTVGLEDLPFSVVDTRSNAVVDGYTQELRLLSPEGSDSPWEWLAGVAYLNYHQVQRSQIPLPLANDAAGPLFGTLPGGPLVTPIGPITGSDDTQFLNTINDSVATEKAVFGEVTRKFGDHFELTAGARLYQTHLVADTQFIGPQALALYQTTNKMQQLETKEQDINPKLALRVLFNRNVQLYALVAKGFQFGGVQLNPPSAALAAPTEAQGGFEFGPYKSSTLWNYELGLKTEWFDRRMQFDVTGFYLDWKDLQLTQPIAIDLRPIIPQPQTLFTAIRNVGAAHSAGVEAALSITPARGLNFTSSAAWIKAVVDEEFGDGSGSQVPKGTRLPGSPRFAMANTMSYATPIEFLGNIETGFALTHTHNGTYFNSLTGTPTEAGGYDLIDARVSLAMPQWRVAPEINVSLNNVFDVRGAVFSGDANGTRNPFYFLVPPRTLVLSLQIRY